MISFLHLSGQPTPRMLFLDGDCISLDNSAALEVNPREKLLTTSLDVVLQGQGMEHERTLWDKGQQLFCNNKRSSRSVEDL